jgi:ketosteroid isomerase-like protein
MDEDQARGIEWDCQKLVRQYYRHVDQREFDEACTLFTEDIDWYTMGVRLKGRDELRKALTPALGKGTIRHVVTNMVVKVVDEDHAESDFYHTIYFEPDSEFETHDGPIPFEGPHRTHDQHDWYVRTDDGWRIAKRVSHEVFRRNPDEPVSLETWASDAGKTGEAPSS